MEKKKKKEKKEKQVCAKIDEKGRLAHMNRSRTHRIFFPLHKVQSVTASSSASAKIGLSITLPGRTYVLRFTKEDDRDAWLRAVAAQVEAIKNNKPNMSAKASAAASAVASVPSSSASSAGASKAASRAPSAAGAAASSAGPMRATATPSKVELRGLGDKADDVSNNNGGYVCKYAAKFDQEMKQAMDESTDRPLILQVRHGWLILIV